MGFGLLIIGYSTLLLLRIVPIEIIGFFVMYLGLEKLSRSEKKFRYAKYASILMFAESILSSLMWIDKSFPTLSLGLSDIAWLESTESILYQTGLLVFHLLLYYGINAISKVSGYDKGVKRTRFALVTTGIYYVAAITGSVLGVFWQQVTEVMARPVWIMQLIFMIVNLFLIAGCFMMIVTDEMLEKEDEKYAAFIEKNPKLVSQKEKKEMENAKKLKIKNEKKAKKAAKRYTATQNKK